MDLLSIRDLNNRTIEKFFSLANEIKANPLNFSCKLEGKNFVFIFQKPSTRTRVSFEVGINQMGGSSTYLGGKAIGLVGREPIKDIARVLSRYSDCIIARTYAHADLCTLREFSNIPVINALSDLEHPCQALSDIFTLYEKNKDYNSIKFTYLGDGNNVLNSLLLVCSQLGIDFTMSIPQGYEPNRKILDLAEKFSATTKSKINIVSNPEEAVKGANVLYTDVWVSMGQEDESEKRKKDFANYQINAQLVSLAEEGCIIMHCLPAHRGEEITDEVIESEKSIIFDQAENRLYVQKAILLWAVIGIE